jgi:hypothetical protein
MPNLEELMDQSELRRSPPTTDPRLKNARRIATAGGALASLLLFVAIIGVAAYEWLMLVMLSIPWVAVGLTWYYKGTFRFYYSRKSLYPSLSGTALLAETAAGIVIFGSYGIYEWDKTFWLTLAVWTILVFLVWAVACGAAIAQEKDNFGTLASLIVAVALYCFSALIFTNCNYDRSTPQIWRVAITKKHYSGARHTTYSLQLSPWGRFTDGEWVDVPSGFYHHVVPGDSVSVYLKAGKWGIPWYQVAKE